MAVKSKCIEKLLSYVPERFQTRRSFYTFAFFGIVLLLHYAFNVKSHRETLDEIVLNIRKIIPTGDGLTNVSETILQHSKCPACFGTDLCEDFEQGLLRIKPQLISDKDMPGGSYYYGQLETTEIVVKTLASEQQWTQFDNFICYNTSSKINCSVSAQIKKTFMVKHQVFSASHFRKAYRFAHKNIQDLPFATCLLNNFLDKMKEMNEIGGDNLEEMKTAELYTSAAVNQEALLLQYFKSSMMVWPFIQTLGSCGRVIVVLSGKRFVRNMLQEIWPLRVSIALQMLRMVDFFINEDQNIAVYIPELKIDKFVINDHDRVLYADLSEMLLLEKGNQDYESTPFTEKCNLGCFAEFNQGLFGTDQKRRRKMCNKFSQIASNIMYARVCRHILSDLPEHKPSRMSSKVGLLHDAPVQYVSAISKYLRLCVEENQAGERLKTVEKLIELLQKIFEDVPTTDS